MEIKFSANHLSPMKHIWEALNAALRAGIESRINSVCIIL